MFIHPKKAKKKYPKTFFFGLKSDFFEVKLRENQENSIVFNTK
jgi:hypothetical protein